MSWWSLGEKTQLLGLFLYKHPGYQAPSLWNLIKCMNGEFFGWEASTERLQETEGGKNAILSHTKGFGYGLSP